MSATFDLWQQSYVLARESGALGLSVGKPTTLAAKLAGDLTNFYGQYQAQLGTWTTVWGPVVFEHNPSDLSVADNAMYVAANGDQSVYLVGIAGTNPFSSYDINSEDKDVSNVVSWAQAFPSLGNYGIPSGLGSINPYLSAGTALGVNNLLGMQDGTTGKTLVQFLQGLVQSGYLDATLIFCGHSLGGALSPTLALALINPAGGPLSLAEWKDVCVYPTAGPTPGNADFNTFFASQLGPVAPASLPYQVWNQNVWNTLDVVPHAWQLSMLAEITTIYPSPWQQNPQNAPQELLQNVAGAEQSSTEGGQAGLGAYVMLNNQSLVGTFNSQIPVTNYLSFAQQLGYQHINEYEQLLNVQTVPASEGAKATYTTFAKRLLAESSQVAAVKQSK